MNYLKLTTLSFLLIFMACQTGSDSLDVADGDTPIDNISLSNSTISANDAKKIALAFVNKMKTVTRSAEFNKSVSSVYAWRSSDIYHDNITRGTATSILPDTLLYIVNFDSENGYALVSASPKVIGVVAYIEDGALSPTDEIDNPGFQLFLDGYRDYFERRDSIENLIQVPFLNFYEVEYCAGPLLTTNWGQGAPYNYECFTDSGEQAVAGCVAVAIGQIAAYHHYPSYAITNGVPFDWNSFMCYEQVPVSDPDASYNVALLLHDIGLLVDMNYGVNSSGAYFDDVEYVWDCYNYHSQKEYSANFDSIMVDISNGFPVFMRGTREYMQNGEVKRSGHAWVVDGVAIKSAYLICYHSIGEQPEIVIMTQNLVHCNWGWNGNNNGYFIIGAFENRYNLENDYIESGYRPYNINNYVYRNIYPYDD